MSRIERARRREEKKKRKKLIFSLGLLLGLIIGLITERILPSDVKKETTIITQCITESTTEETTIITQCITESTTEGTTIITQCITEPTTEETTLMVNLTDNEKIILSKIVYAEAGIEPYDGKVAVAATVITRMLQQNKSLEEVIDGKYAKITHLSDDDIPENCKKAVQEALRGIDPTYIPLGNKRAMWFYNPDDCSPEQLEMRSNIQKTYRIGNHIFYAVWDK